MQMDARVPTKVASAPIKGNESVIIFSFCLHPSHSIARNGNEMSRMTLMNIKSVERYSDGC